MDGDTDPVALFFEKEERIIILARVMNVYRKTKERNSLVLSMEPGILIVCPHVLRTSKRKKENIILSRSWYNGVGRPRCTNNHNKIII